MDPVLGVRYPELSFFDKASPFGFFEDLVGASSSRLQPLVLAHVGHQSFMGA